MRILKNWKWIAESNFRRFCIIFQGQKILKELEHIQSLIKFKEGRLTDTEAECLRHATESIYKAYFWYKKD